MRRVSLFLFCLLALVELSQALTFNRSTGAGLASDGTRWSTGVSPCGAGGDNVFVVIQTSIAKDCGFGGSSVGINSLRIEAGGTLYSYDGVHTGCQTATLGYTSTQGNLTDYYNSTGTDPIGGGTITNPGSGATAFGIFMSYGTFCYMGGASDQLTSIAANGTSPIYFTHISGAYSGGINITTGGETGGALQGTHGATASCYYCNFIHLGSSSFPRHMEGLSYETKSAEVTPNSTLDIEHCNFTSPYEFTNGANSGVSNPWTIEYCTFDGPTSQYDIYLTGGQNGRINIIGNTEINSTVNNGAMLNPTGTVGTVTFQNNVIIGNASGTIQRGGSQTASPPVLQHIDSNVCLNAEGTVSAPSDCVNAVFADNDTTSTVGGNVCWGAPNCFKLGNAYTTTTNCPTVENNWGAVYKEAAGPQGIYESAGYCIHLRYNIGIVENDNNNAALLLYASAAHLAYFQIDNMTIHFVSPGTASSNCYSLGDAAGTNIVSPSHVLSNICTGARHGTIVSASTSYETTDCAGSTTGWCNNLFYNISLIEYCVNGGFCNTTPNGTGYWDGTRSHPNAVYNDLDGINPDYVDPTRRPTGYSTYCGGAGTIADLGAQYALRNGLGAAYNHCYDIPRMLAWLFNGFAPRNRLLMFAGYKHTFVGAVKPIVSPVNVQ